MSAIRAQRRAPLLQVAKAIAATLAAWFLSLLVIPSGPPPVFAAIAALLVVQPSLNQSMTKAVERSTGVLVGVIIASALGLWLGPSSWVLMVAVAASLAVAWALKMTAGTTNQVGISALLVLALGAATPEYGIARVGETVVGAVIGFVVNLAVVAPVAVAPARQAIADLSDEVAASLERLADALERPLAPADREELLLTARLLRPMRDRAQAAIDAAEESLALNPRGRRHRADLASTQALLGRMASIVTQTVGMTRTFYDRYDDTVSDEPEVRGIAEQLRRAAHDVRLSRRASAGAAAPTTETLPALTRPFTVSRPSPAHWILVGSLLEDLHRIHEELADSA